jgi:Plasmid encoded RepA protein
MPLRHNENNRQRWQTKCGSVSLVIRAGELLKPDTQADFKLCDVPAGPKARIITAYINDYAYRHKTPQIELGRNLHQAMQRMKIGVGGKNSKELTREVENIAAAEILMGLWLPDGNAHQKTAKISEDVSFWIEKNPDQQTIWQPTMTLSRRYYASIEESQHIAPIYWPAYVALQHNARAMDIHNFLTYRLRTIRPNRPVTIHADALKSQFGRDIQEQRHFWPHFVKALREALEQYPQAKNSVALLEDNSGVRLGYAQPIIPYKKLGRIE